MEDGRIGNLMVKLVAVDDETTKIEAIAIELTDELSKSYDVYYRTHCQDYGWLGWAKNGEKAGSEGYSKRMEAIEIRLVQKRRENARNRRRIVRCKYINQLGVI